MYQDSEVLIDTINFDRSCQILSKIVNAIQLENLALIEACYSFLNLVYSLLKSDIN